MNQVIYHLADAQNLPVSCSGAHYTTALAACVLKDILLNTCL